MSITGEESRFRLLFSVRSMHSNRGFTIIELIVVCAILGILATMVMNSVSGFRQKVKVARAAAEIRGLEKDIFSFTSEKGFYPPDINAVGVETLKTTLDPWGNPYVYTVAPTRTFIIPINTDFDLYSKGPDGVSTVPSTQLGDGQDDIIRGNDGSFVGTAVKYP